MKLSPSSLAFFGAVAAVAPGVSAFAPSAASSSPRVMELFATKKVFIDGEAGTTGLQVRDRLGKRTDIEIISPPPELRKDEETRKKFINEADAVILCALKVACRDLCLHAPCVCLCFPCQSSIPFRRIMLTNSNHSQSMSLYATHTTGLPDAASIEASKMVDADNDRTVLIDASTAFRVDDEWTYGFPGEYYPFVSQVDDVVILVHDIINSSHGIARFLSNEQMRRARPYYYTCILYEYVSIAQSYQRISATPSRRAREFPTPDATPLDSSVLLVPSSKRGSFPRVLH